MACPTDASPLGLGPTVTPHAEAGATPGFVLSVSQLKTTRTCTALPGQWSRKHRLSSCSPENRRPSDPRNTSRASSPAAGRSGAVARGRGDAARARRVRGAVAKAASLRQRNRKLCNRTAVHVQNRRPSQPAALTFQGRIAAIQQGQRSGRSLTAWQSIRFGSTVNVCAARAAVRPQCCHIMSHHPSTSGPWPGALRLCGRRPTGAQAESIGAPCGWGPGERA